MINKDSIVGVANLMDRATEVLKQVSFGLDIVSIDVAIVMNASPVGVRPLWLIVYQAKGLLVGPKNYVTQATGFDTPFVSDEELRAGLEQGCMQLRESRAKQGNGIVKGH